MCTPYKIEVFVDDSRPGSETGEGGEFVKNVTGQDIIALNKGKCCRASWKLALFFDHVITRLY